MPGRSSARIRTHRGLVTAALSASRCRLGEHVGIRVQTHDLFEEVSEPECDNAWAATDVKKAAAAVECQRRAQRVGEALRIREPTPDVVGRRTGEQSLSSFPILPTPHAHRSRAYEHTQPIAEAHARRCRQQQTADTGCEMYRHIPVAPIYRVAAAHIGSSVVKFRPLRSGS